MNRPRNTCFILVPVWLSAILFAAPLNAQDNPSIEALQSTKRSDYVSDASHLVGTYEPTDVKHDAASMTAAAKSFLDSLDKDQRKRAALSLDDRERREWTNLPAPRNAGGVRMGDLNEAQTKLACQLLATLLSDHGYRKMRNIMLADDQLLRGGRARPGFGTENFSLVIFGEPSATEAWAFQLDGHHVGMNLAIKGDSITMAPSFIGTQPHQFSIGDQKFKPFAKETGLAHKLMNSLTDDQIKAAVLSNRRGRIVTGPGNDGKTPPPQGLACDQLDDEQKKLLTRLIAQWVNDLPKEKAKARMKEIKGEMEQMRLSWNGNKAAGSDVSYRIQSPSLIIEYACQDLGNDPLDHLHSMYRNPKNDYGGQLK
ncbi:MAG: DUF3500 domain-containing protein [Planctomycetota bacterium]